MLSGGFSPWLQLKGHQGYFARLKYTNSDYNVQLTDLNRVWFENLPTSAIVQRQQECKCVVESSSGADVAAFGDFLAKRLVETTLDQEFPAKCQMSISHTALDSKIEFRFDLQELGLEASRTVLKEFILDLYGVLQNMAGQVYRGQQVIYEKNFHIRAMADALARSSDYTPRRYEAAYTQAFDREPVPEEYTQEDLVRSFWPEAAVEEPAGSPGPESPPSTPEKLSEEQRLKRRSRLKEAPLTKKKARRY